jgi:hypothetical protein
MGEETLVESQISDSIALVKSLEEQGHKPSAVVWYYFPDAGEWRLLLAGPTFDALLPKDESRAYQVVAEALNRSQVKSLTIGEIKLVRTDYSLLKAMRFLIGTPSDAIVRAHFKDNSINGIFIKEMLVLRSSLAQDVA